MYIFMHVYYEILPLVVPLIQYVDCHEVLLVLAPLAVSGIVRILHITL